MRPVLRSALRFLATGAVIVLAIAMLLIFAEVIASFGVGRATAAEITFGLLILGSFVVYMLARR